MAVRAGSTNSVAAKACFSPAGPTFATSTRRGVDPRYTGHQPIDGRSVSIYTEKEARKRGGGGEERGVGVIFRQLRRRGRNQRLFSPLFSLLLFFYFLFCLLLLLWRVEARTSLQRTRGERRATPDVRCRHQRRHRATLSRTELSASSTSPTSTTTPLSPLIVIILFPLLAANNNNNAINFKIFYL